MFIERLGANLVAFLRDDNAPTAVEYALMVGAIVLVVAGAAYALGGRIASVFTRTSGALR